MWGNIFATFLSTFWRFFFFPKKIRSILLLLACLEDYRHVRPTGPTACDICVLQARSAVVGGDGVRLSLAGRPLPEQASRESEREADVLLRSCPALNQLRPPPHHLCTALCDVCWYLMDELYEVEVPISFVVCSGALMKPVGPHSPGRRFNQLTAYLPAWTPPDEF